MGKEKEIKESVKKEFIKKTEAYLYEHLLGTKNNCDEYYKTWE